MHHQSFATFLYGALLVAGGAAQGSADAGPHPGFLRQYAETYRFTLGQPKSPAITRQGDAVVFLRSGPRSFVNSLYEFDVESGAERLLASAEDLLAGATEELTAEELARRERTRSAARGIASFELSRDGQQVLIPLSGSLFLLQRTTGEIRELKSSAGFPIDARLSPDGKHVACVRNGDLYVTDVASGDERRLTSGASDTLEHGLAEFVAQEEMSRMHGYWWSPDSRHLAYQQTDVADVELLYIADPAAPAKPPRAWRYPRPGKHNARVRLGVIALDGGETTWIRWDQERFPYLAFASWQDKAPLTLLIQNRTQTEQVLLAADAETGAVTQLLKETDDAWLDLDHSVPRWLADGKQFLWSSQRSGQWELELRADDGGLVRKLTPSDLGYRSLIGLDEQASCALVSASPDPKETQVYRIALNSSDAPTPVTDEPGLNHAIVSPRRGVMVRMVNSRAGAVSATVYRADGSRAGELKSVAESPPFLPNLELVSVGEDVPLHAAVVRPRNFAPDARQQYPVIVDVYGGPGAQTVQASRRRYLMNQWIADHGFIVVSIDGRGTPGRGRKWERAIKGDLVAAPLEDQVRGLKSLAARYEEMDASRVGIFGWSFGGYMSAMAVMQRPDVFHAGVAGAPVADWRDYDTHYTERYLGLPADNTSGYEASSVLTHAPQLRRPLLIIHGTADDNVYFLHSIKMCDALFRAGRPYEFMPLAGFTHMVPDPAITERLYDRIVGFFIARLTSAAGVTDASVPAATARTTGAQRSP